MQSKVTNMLRPTNCTATTARTSTGSPISVAALVLKQIPTPYQKQSHQRNMKTIPGRYSKSSAVSTAHSLSRSLSLAERKTPIPAATCVATKQSRSLARFWTLWHVGMMVSVVPWVLLPQTALAGLCREAQLCCTGRDSSCVVQKAPLNAIIEDLSDKPCYCDHACLKLGDCCEDFKDYCGVLDCQVSDWGEWSECDKNCGTGMMSRTRTTLQQAQNGGKHCPSLMQKRGCQGFRCHGHRDKKLVHERALLLPASLSQSRHANDSSDIRHNLRVRYRDSYKHDRQNEYCVEFEVIKASKACQKLPPYNLMVEGDRITVRCDLEALIQDGSTVPNTDRLHRNTAYISKYLQPTPADIKREISNNSAAADEDESNTDDEENMVEGETEEVTDYEAKTTLYPLKSTTLTTTEMPLPNSHYHCRGEGLSGRTTRWNAMPTPSCHGKWLRLTVGAPKRCTQSQFIFI